MLWRRRKCVPACQGSNTRDPRPWIKYLQGKHHATCFPTSILLSHVTQSASRCHKPGRATDGSWCWNTRARLLPSSLRSLLVLCCLHAVDTCLCWGRGRRMCAGCREGAEPSWAQGGSWEGWNAPVPGAPAWFSHNLLRHFICWRRGCRVAVTGTYPC